MLSKAELFFIKKKQKKQLISDNRRLSKPRCLSTNRMSDVPTKRHFRPNLRILDFHIVFVIMKMQAACVKSIKNNQDRKGDVCFSLSFIIDIESVQICCNKQLMKRKIL